MGFWGSLGELLASVSEANDEAVHEAAKLSTYDLCAKINSLNPLVNPLIYTACSEELTKRVKQMPKWELLNYYDDYEGVERSDAKNIFVVELERRGIKR